MIDKVSGNTGVGRNNNYNNDDDEVGK